MSDTAYLTTLRIGRGATPTWTTITDFEALKLPGKEKSDIRTTKLDTPGGVHRYIPSPFSEMSDLTFTVSYEPDSAQDTYFETLMAAQNEIVQIEVLVNGATNVKTYVGYIKTYDIAEFEIETEMKASIAFKIVGVTI